MQKKGTCQVTHQSLTTKMPKYSEQIVEKICSLIASDDYTVAEICKQVGINRDTYFAWKTEKSDFSDSIKKAEAERLETFKKAARSGLLTLLNGTQYDEEQTEYGSKVGTDGEVTTYVKARKVTTKFILPNPTSVIFALKNVDNENFKDIFSQEHSGSIATDLIIKGEKFADKG